MRATDPNRGTPDLSPASILLQISDLLSIFSRSKRAVADFESDVFQIHTSVSVEEAARLLNITSERITTQFRRRRRRKGVYRAIFREDPFPELVGIFVGNRWRVDLKSFNACRDYLEAATTPTSSEEKRRFKLENLRKDFADFCAERDKKAGGR